MANNETVAEIVRKMLKVAAFHTAGDQVSDLLAEIPIDDYAERIEAAHNRALAAKDDERLTIVANYENIIAAKDAKIAELRAKLKVAEDAIQDAIEEYCHKCNVSEDDRREVCDQCHVCDWKEALATIRGEGVNDEAE